MYPDVYIINNTAPYKTMSDYPISQSHLHDEMEIGHMRWLSLNTAQLKKYNPTQPKPWPYCPIEVFLIRSDAANTNMPYLVIITNFWQALQSDLHNCVNFS